MWFLKNAILTDLNISRNLNFCPNFRKKWPKLKLILTILNICFCCSRWPGLHEPPSLRNKPKAIATAFGRWGAIEPRLARQVPSSGTVKVLSRWHLYAQGVSCGQHWYRVLVQLGLGLGLGLGLDWGWKCWDNTECPRIPEQLLLGHSPSSCWSIFNVKPIICTQCIMKDVVISLKE